MAAQSPTISRPVPVAHVGNPFSNIGAFARDRIAVMGRVTAQCGPIGGLRYGPFTLLIIADPDLAHSLLVDHAADNQKSALFAAAAREAVSGDSLVTHEGDAWKRQRKLMAPAFAHRRIAAYADTMAHYGQELQAGWRDGQTININKEMAAVTMSVVGKALFDADVFGETDDLGAAFLTVVDRMGDRVNNMMEPPLWLPTPNNRRVQAARQLINQRIGAMIAERKRIGNLEQRSDVLSLLLAAKDESGQGMSDQQLLSECVALFLAGHETTAVSLVWAFYLLSQHLAVYDKLKAEVDAVLQGRTPTYEDLAKLPYNAQIIKEVMRLYPATDSIARQPIRDYDLAGYKISRFSPVVVSINALHRRADFFPQPEAFQPERWTTAFEQGLPRYAYMPFGGGGRICIGMHFALMEAQLLLAQLTQHAAFSLTPGQQVEVWPHFTVRPRKDITMHVTRRS